MHRDASRAHDIPLRRALRTGRILPAGGAQETPQPDQAETHERIEAEDILGTLNALKKELLKAQKPDGSWEGTSWPFTIMAIKGGQTALVTWALLQAGEDPFSEPILKAANYLLSIEKELGRHVQPFTAVHGAGVAGSDRAGW